MAFDYTIDLIEGDEVRKYSDESDWYKPEERIYALYAKRMWLITWTLHEGDIYKHGILKFHEFYTLLTMLEGRVIAPGLPKYDIHIHPALLWQFNPPIEDIGKTYRDLKQSLDEKFGRLPPSDGPTKRGWNFAGHISLSIGKNMKHQFIPFGDANAWYALDYDGTYSDNLVAWDKAIDIFRAAGIIPIIVTMRFSNEPLHVLRTDVPIIYTGRMAKVDFVNRVAPHGFKFDVWIDDMPHFLTQDAFIPNKKAPLGNEHRLEKYEQFRTNREEFASILNSQLELLKTGWPDYQSA